MTRWFVGVKQNGQREVFSESAGINPVAAPGGYDEVCGPYSSERDAIVASKIKPAPNRADIPKRRTQPETRRRNSGR